MFRTESTTGSVESVSWECRVEVLGLRDVTEEAWRDQVPQDAKLGACSQRVRETLDHQVPNSKEVCGTPYEVDKGNGYAERVQDCVYEVYDDFCKYTVKKWSVVDTLVTDGTDYQPYCQDVIVSSSQRQGESALDFVAYFETERGTLEYRTSDEAVFQQFQPGTEWTLEVNTFGQVVGVGR